MGRGVSAGGGQSSLGYLFGGGETPSAPTQNRGNPASAAAPPPAAAPAPPAAASPSPPPVEKQIPAGVNSKTSNNYYRADGQNCGNFITERPSTKVHAAPGGGSSLGYLFGDGSNSK